MRGSQLVTLTLVSMAGTILAQTKFGSSSSGKGGGASSTNTKFFTGNEGIDGGLIGFGLGAAAGAVGAPLLEGFLGGGGSSGCAGRRKRSADGDERFFLGGSSCTCGKRRKRQAPGEDKPTNTRFFNLFGGGGNQQQHCGSCCYSGGYNNGGYNNGGYNNGGYNSGYNTGGYNNNNNGGCQCNNQLTFHDQYGNTHGACRSSDNTR